MRSVGAGRHGIQDDSASSRELMPGWRTCRPDILAIVAAVTAWLSLPFLITMDTVIEGLCWLLCASALAETRRPLAESWLVSQFSSSLTWYDRAVSRGAEELRNLVHDNTL